MEHVDILLVDPQNGFRTFCRRVLLNHTLTQTPRVLLNRVEPDLSGQGTAESRRDEPAPVPTDESNSDPVEVSAESHSEPGTRTNASDCEPVLVDESTKEATSLLFDYSLLTGDQICDQTSAENSPSNEDDALLDAEDCDEDLQGIEPEKIMKPTRPCPDARYSLRRHVLPPSQLMCVNLCLSSGRASSKGGSDYGNGFLQAFTCSLC